MATSKKGGTPMFTVVSATVFVGIQAIATGIAAGWAIAGLFNLGDAGEYVLMALFAVPALYATYRYGRSAAKTEAALAA
ncbi:hypothetical protein [Aquabacter cavernae]|uniref:hypothetical protein n=1 Tax=Aquabacter cavernae TaxID=2496029 RepID=UPI000F8F0805|nr:hypothetical protein [Aquabacter cavernae]